MTEHLGNKGESFTMKRGYKVESLGNGIERDYLFDNIKAILIISVVAAHFMRASVIFDRASFSGMIYIISFSYIMQGFLFVSGYFSRNPMKCRKTAFESFLFPYLVLMPFMFCIRDSIFGHAQLDLTLPTMALWYLVTLFVYRFLLIDFIRIKQVAPISIGLSLLAGFIPALDSTLSIGRTFGFLPFFLFGYYFKSEWIDSLRSLSKHIYVLLFAGLIGFALFLSQTGVIPLESFLYKASYGSTGLSNLEGVTIRILLSIISMLWVVVFLALVPRKRTLLTTIGQNTMTIYVLHIVIRYSIKGLGYHIGTGVMAYMILFAITILTVWALSRPKVAKFYQEFMGILYQMVIAIPLSFVRQIL